MISLETRMALVLETIFESNLFSGPLQKSIGKLLDEYTGNQTTVKSVMELTDEPMFEKDSKQNSETLEVKDDN